MEMKAYYWPTQTISSFAVLPLICASVTWIYEEAGLRNVDPIATDSLLKECIKGVTRDTSKITYNRRVERGSSQ